METPFIPLASVDFPSRPQRGEPKQNFDTDYTDLHELPQKETKKIKTED